jgi:hypothetical protein
MNSQTSEKVTVICDFGTFFYQTALGQIPEDLHLNITAMNKYWNSYSFGRKGRLQKLR